MSASDVIRSRFRRGLLIAVFPAATLSLAAFAPGSAWAQDADIAQARQLGGQAQAAYDAGNYAESEKLWMAAGKLYSQAPTLTLGLARAQAKVGHFVAAQESYNRIVREWANNAAAPTPFKDAVEAAKSEVPAVSARIASVVVTVDGPVSPQVTQVTIDGQALNSVALGLKRPIDPGTHVVDATADGYKPAKVTFQVGEGGAAEAKLKMVKLDDAAVPGAATPGNAGASAREASHDEGTSNKSGSPNKTLAVVAFGVGGAGLVVGAITGLLAIGKHGDLTTQCPNNVCATSQQDTVDSYKTLGTISTVGFVVAGVGVATGAVLWFTAPKESASASTSSAKGAASSTTGTTSAPASRFSWTPYLGLTNAGVTGRF